MDASRASKLIDCEKVDVFCKGEPVIIKAVDEYSKMATVESLKTGNNLIVPLNDIRDEGTIHN
ncbi:H-type small acid-soluble spore protein [Clostridium sp. Marseille-Q2269]|uniref:H-type small acid-soluble spore protein n=1 Tax=Clostridium sp. Marseille-Q2269 TaxID=2942205 RepID=UPI002074034F|nr:H-type small acid-soluble spore protein [Clostridium sp. Marseille-Q2269]